MNQNSKKFCRLPLLVLTVVVLMLITGCGAHIDDPDPSSADLKTITLEKMADTSISHTSSGVSTVSKRYNITIVTQHEKIDLDYVKMNGGKSSGIRSIMATSLKQGQSLRIMCQSNVEKGNLALILLSPDRRILHQFTVNSGDQYQFTADRSGIYFVRMGAESFSGDILLERQFQ